MVVVGFDGRKKEEEVDRSVSVAGQRRIFSSVRFVTIDM